MTHNFQYLTLLILFLFFYRIFNLVCRYAVVTGANKGIGFAVCKQLASKGITVVLTARDGKRGLEAVQKLKQLSLTGLVIFHQLDVTDLAGIRSFADFIRNQFGKLDILVRKINLIFKLFNLKLKWLHQSIQVPN
jgi:(+)-neomenthol dehydrogenase